MINFSPAGWNAALEKINWKLMEQISDINIKSETMSSLMKKALDEIAPKKTFTIKPQKKKLNYPYIFLIIKSIRA